MADHQAGSAQWLGEAETMTNSVRKAGISQVTQYEKGTQEGRTIISRSRMFVNYRRENI